MDFDRPLEDKRSQVGIDEITAVIRPTAETVGDFPENWYQIASELIDVVADKLSLPILFGEIVREKTAPKGYTHAFSFENIPYFFRLAFHERDLTMGVVIKFSASALSFYQQTYQEFYQKTITVPDILKKLDEPYWDMHLSRIDLYADYFNYDVSVDDLYAKLKAEELAVVNYQGRHLLSKISALEIDREAKTLTVGSRKKGSNSFLKVYDKHSEQLENNGRYVHLTQYVQSWIRFEVTYRGRYAKQMTEILLGLDSSDSLEDIIASKIVEKYCLIDKAGKPIEYSQVLLDGAFNAPLFNSASPRNNSLMQSAHYILKGSGFFPLIKKIDTIWGESAVSLLLERLLQEYQSYVPNKDVEHWLNKYYYELVGYDFNEYLDNIIEVFYIKNPLSLENPPRPKEKESKS